MDQLLTRSVAKVIPQALAEQKLQSGEKLRVYLGIDPTGSKLHLGHTVPLRKLQAFAAAGHHAILVIGSFTAMIGDPSGKDQLRVPLTSEEVKENFRQYKAQAAKILDFSIVEIRYNHEWLEKITFRDIINLGSHFTVQQMLQRDMFEKRMADDNPIGVHEFLYPLMVGYDSVVLDVDCELGGTDQEFNILAGRTLQKAYGKRDKFVLTMKLIEGTDGRKMSKTYDNCIYLTDPPGEMYGKVLSIKDDLIVPYMECCTDIPRAEIAEVEHAIAGGENPKIAKMRLARELVTMYHDKTAAEAAQQEFDNVFTKGQVPDEMPAYVATRDESITDIIVASGFTASKAEARRLITQKAVHLNDVPILTIETTATDGVLRVGKRKFLRLSIQ